MKVLFLTTPSNDCENHVRAFRSFHQAEHVVMKCRGIRIDWKTVQKVRDIAPDVVFYISANQGPYALKIKTLKEIRTVAMTVNLCSDAADRPWHGALQAYKNNGCFDLQVSFDGGRHYALDLSTLTPVDPTLYEKSYKRDIKCGFSGSVGSITKRSEIIRALEWFGGLTLRERFNEGGYEDHVSFLRRCKMILNMSWTGTDQGHHIKGRVLEAGWAGCALLESYGSPIGDWFPKDCYFMWKDAKDVAEIIHDADDKEIQKCASRLSEEVKKRFTPKMIYGEILNRIGLNVDNA